MFFVRIGNFDFLVLFTSTPSRWEVIILELFILCGSTRPTSCPLILNEWTIINIFLIFIVLTSLFLSLNSTLEIFLIFGTNYEWFQIRHGKRSSSISTKRSIWLVYSLLEPANQLTPDVARIILLLPLIDGFLFFNRIKVGSSMIFHSHVTLTDPLLITLTLSVFFIRCKVGMSVSIEPENITKGWNSNYNWFYRS